MTFSPASLDALVVYWKAQGGVNLGVVGDGDHVDRGVSYHLGKSALLPGAYSIQTARDKAGLTEAASAIDLGKLVTPDPNDGEYKGLRDFSDWLVDQARHNAPGTSDMREIIWWDRSVDAVMRWDRERGYSSRPRIGEADTSHKTHTHISWYRDAQMRDHTTAFRPYFEESDMPAFKTFATPKLVAVPKGAWIYVHADMSTDPANIQIDPGRDLPVAGTLSDGTLIIGYRDTTPTEPVVPTYYFRGTPKDYPTGSADATSCKPYTDPLNAQIAQLQTDVANAHIAGERAEWDRQNAGATVAVNLLDRP